MSLLDGKSDEYKKGFSTGYYGHPCPSNCSADFQAGWLDGRQVKQDIQHALTTYEDTDTDCPNCGHELG